MRLLNQKISQWTGLTIAEFCRHRLGMTQCKYRWRLDKGHLYMSEIIYLCELTGESFEDLFLDDPKIAQLREEIRKKIELGEPLGNFKKRKIRRKIEFIG